APAAEALPQLTAALHLSRRAHDPAGEAETHLALARRARQRRDWRDAEEHIEAALAIVESLRLKVAATELRSTYLAATRDYYELQIDLLMDREQSEPGAGHAAAALHVSERARARSLLELL